MSLFRPKDSLAERSRKQAEAVELIASATGPLAVEAVLLIRTLPEEEAEEFGRKFVANIATQAIIGQDFYWDASTCVSRAREFATTSIHLDFLGEGRDAISVDYSGMELRRATIEAALPAYSQPELFDSEQ